MGKVEKTFWKKEQDREEMKGVYMWTREARFLLKCQKPEVSGLTSAECPSPNSIRSWVPHTSSVQVLLLDR